jgi:hypothetical protein
MTANKGEGFKKEKYQMLSIFQGEKRIESGYTSSSLSKRQTAIQIKVVQ